MHNLYSTADPMHEFPGILFLSVLYGEQMHSKIVLQIENAVKKQLKMLDRQASTKNSTRVTSNLGKIQVGCRTDFEPQIRPPGE